MTKLMKRENVKAEKKLKKEMRRRTSVVKRPRDVAEHSRQQKVWKITSKTTMKGIRIIPVSPVASNV